MTDAPSAYPAPIQPAAPDPWHDRRSKAWPAILTALAAFVLGWFIVPALAFVAVGGV